MQNMCVHMPCSMGTRLQASTMLSSKRHVNVCLELQRRRWVAVEGWDWQLLHRYCEYRSLQCIRSNPRASSCHEVVRARDSASTVALAFSSDGTFMASGHLHHDITVFRISPRVQHLQTLSTHHSRTPWCLVFGPTEDRILYSGGLEGNVCKWNVETGECLKDLKASIASPVNSITFLPSIPGHILVAKDHWLSLLSCSSLDTVWQASTGNSICRVRLVMSHPRGDRILTAVANEPPSKLTPFAFSLRTPSLRTTYKLQLYPFDKDCRPDLEDSSYRLLCLSARICGQQSCAITNSAVICISSKNSDIQLSVYSVLPQTFGQCVYSIPVAQMHVNPSSFSTGDDVGFHEMLNIVSLSMSPSNSYLLLGIARKKDMAVYHMGRRHAPGPVAKILQFNPDAVQKLQPICTLNTSSEPTSRSLSCNVALWGPPRAGGGVFMGMTRGGVVVWGSPFEFTMDNVEDIELMAEWDDVKLSKKKLKT